MVPAKKVAAGKKPGQKGAVVVAAQKEKGQGKGTIKGKGKGKAQQGKRNPHGLGAKGTANAAKASSVIYLGHIPNGFFENQMRKFFAQFGVVKRVKLFRSQKTGGSKGYGFIEFEEAATAAVTAEAMDGYFLAERQLKCHVVPPAQLHSGMFARPKRADANADDGEDKGAETVVEEAESPEKDAKQAKKLMAALRAKQKKLQAMGIDFDLFT